MFKANNIDEYRATADMINGIVERVNGGQCAEYCKAEFFKAYPACLWLVGRDGEQIAIYALDAITDTGDGYMIDYMEYDIDSGERLPKTLCLDFQ